MRIHIPEDGPGIVRGGGKRRKYRSTTTQLNVECHGNVPEQETGRLNLPFYLFLQEALRCGNRYSVSGKALL